MKDKVNEIQISYKECATPIFCRKISSSQDAGELLFQHWNKNTIAVQESFKVVLLNNSNKVKGIYELSKGGITGTLVDMRLLFGVVLKTLSVGIILTHNHPSGKLEASKADIELTTKIKKAAALFDINVLDHLIIAPNGDYYSFADNSILWIMFYLNYTNLDAETQERLLSVSKAEIESKFGEDLRAYAKENHMEYDTILYEEAVKNLYNYKYVFNI